MYFQYSNTLIRVDNKVLPITSAMIKERNLEDSLLCPVKLFCKVTQLFFTSTTNVLPASNIIFFSNIYCIHKVCYVYHLMYISFVVTLMFYAYRQVIRLYPYINLEKYESSMFYRSRTSSNWQTHYLNTTISRSVSWYKSFHLKCVLLEDLVDLQVCVAGDAAGYCRTYMTEI